jgi:hypothetical protein
MSPLPRRSPLALLSLAAACLTLSGCASRITVQNAANLMTGPAQASPVRIDASAAIQVTYTVDQGIENYWKGRGFSEAEIVEINRLITAAITNDLSTTGLFSRVLAPGGSERPDYQVKVEARSLYNPDERFSLALTIAPGAHPEESVTMSREYRLGEVPGGWLSTIMPQCMAETKTAISAGVERLRRAELERVESAKMREASFLELLHAEDRTEALARERNRILIEAKTRQLPGILRDSKTAELTTLLVKVEQTILDLDHECEVNKDKAQRALASEGGQAQAEALRGLAISYRERIELLKPIAVALKDELANRER